MMFLVPISVAECNVRASLSGPEASQLPVAGSNNSLVFDPPATSTRPSVSVGWLRVGPRKLTGKANLFCVTPDRNKFPENITAEHSSHMYSAADNPY
jgi:hypothetical protein